MKMTRKPEQNADGKTITFFKILIGGFMKEMMIPPGFVKEYKEMMPETLTLKSHNLGKSSVVSVTKNEDGFFIKHGWKNFVKDNCLVVGDLLIFNLVQDTTFEVLIYGPTCCLKKIKSKETPSKNRGRAKLSHFKKSRVSATETGEKAKRPRIFKEKIEVVKKENLVDDDDTVSKKKSKETSFKKRGRPKSSQLEKPQVSATNSGKKAKRSRIFKEKIEVNKKGNVAEEVKHPYFKLELKEYQKYNVMVPIWFVRKTGLDNMRKTLIQDPRGRKWPVSVNLSAAGDQYYFSTGWRLFYQANGLVIGDTLILHFKQEHGNLITAEIHKGGKDARTKPCLSPTQVKSETMDISV